MVNENSVLLKKFQTNFYTFLRKNCELAISIEIIVRKARKKDSIRDTFIERFHAKHSDRKLPFKLTAKRQVSILDKDARIISLTLLTAFDRLYVEIDLKRY